MKSSQLLFLKILRGPDEHSQFTGLPTSAVCPSHQESGLGYCFAPCVWAGGSHHPSGGEPGALLLYPATLQSSILSVSQTADRKSHSRGKETEHLQRHRGTSTRKYACSILPSAKVGTLQKENQLWPLLPLGTHV